VIVSEVVLPRREGDEGDHENEEHSDDDEVRVRKKVKMPKYPLELKLRMIQCNNPQSQYQQPPYFKMGGPLL